MPLVKPMISLSIQFHGQCKVGTRVDIRIGVPRVLLKVGLLRPHRLIRIEALHVVCLLDLLG